VVLKLADPRLGIPVLTTFYLNVQLLDCAVSIPDRVLE